MCFESKNISMEYISDLLSWDNKGNRIRFDGKTIEFLSLTEGVDEASMIFTTSQIPKESTGYYFEVKIEEGGENGILFVGFARGNEKSRDAGLPGREDNSILYISTKEGAGLVIDGEPNCQIEPYGKSDIVGCGISRFIIDEVSYCNVYFTKNGRKFEVTKFVEDGDYYPTIGTYSTGAKLTSNLGEDKFLFENEGAFYLYTKMIKVFSNINHNIVLVISKILRLES